MSIVFTSTKTAKTSQGYFRIGATVLEIPPTDIVTSHNVNNERVGVIRGANEMFHKTGQSRFDTSITFTAVLNELSGSDSKYTQWTDVQNILAMFKCAPFVEVESPYLRQVLSGTDPSLGVNQTLAMALRQLKIYSHPDIVDGIIVTLTMTYFNYQPYSVNFEYQSGEKDQSNGKDVPATDAAHSQPFKDYLAGWIANNITNKNQVKGDPPPPKDWKKQNPGVIGISYRIYDVINTGQIPQLATNLSSTSSVGGTPTQPGIQLPSSVLNAPSKVGKHQKLSGKLPPDIANIVIAAANKYGVDPAIAQALCYHESSGDPNAYNKMFGASGLFQFIGAKLMAQYNVTNPFDPVQAADGGCHYLSDLLKLEKTYELALGAYYVGSGTIKKYGGLPPADEVIFGYKPNAPAYVAAIIASAYANYGYKGGPPTIPDTPAPVKSVTPPTYTNTQIAIGSSNPITNTNSYSEQELEAVINYMCTNLGYEVDHRAEVGGVVSVFLFRVAELKVGPIDSPEKDLQPGLFPTQLSVLFVNNLAQIPLSIYQFPTYQHVGPTSSTIQISFMSRGFVVGDEDPQHPGLQQLALIASNLEKQYHEMQGKFRSVWSVHRMQAVFIENKILNLLGISGLMVDQITTQTVSESSDMVSVQLTGSQYENIFEEIESYKLNGISQQYVAAVNNLVFNTSQLDNLSGDEAKILTALTDYKKAAASGDPTWLSAQLLNMAKSSGPDPSYIPEIAQEQMFPASNSLWDAIPTNQVNDYPWAQKRAGQLNGANYWNIVDYLMYKAVVSDSSVTPASSDDANSAMVYLSQTEINIANTKTAQVKQAYLDLFPYFSANNIALRSAVNQVMNSPKYSSQIQAAVPVDKGDPGKHGSYSAMRLANLPGKDANPASYFISDQDNYRSIAKENLQTILKQIDSTSDKANAPTNGGSNAGNVVPKNFTTIPGMNNADTIMSMINIPGYDMSEAFPAIKLMFMEDANEGIYYAFDNFFSYATITDIEMERPTDKPATLRVQLTNLAHLLDNKLYDGTLAGAWDHTLEKYASLTASSDNGAVTGSGTLSASVNKQGPGSAAYQLEAIEGSDNIEGARGGVNYKRVPLQYFPLQTGTKIQLRVGNTNDPDQLFPVFCGQVTEIEGGDIITITAQSYLLELCSQLGDDAQTDSWCHLGNLLGAIGNVGKSGISSIGEGGSGPAYGGFTIWGDSADSGTIISKMLKNSSAKHFGHWQIDQLPNSFLKGFGWKELTLPALGVVSDTLSNMTAYDRTDENINIIRSTQFDGGSVGYKTAHPYADEGVFYRPLAYHVDSATSWTTWELLQDIARRYPEYLMLEKWYGFPYGANATLVYGHPFDWYWARQKLVGDQEIETIKLSNKDLYREWWNNGGSALVSDMFNEGTFVGSKEMINHSSASYSDLIANENYFIGELTGTNVVTKTLDTLLRSSWVPLVGKYNRDQLRIIQEKQAQIEISLNAFITSKNGTGGKVVSSDILKPIRRYHFIDHNSLIHNGMSINSKVYNCVKIGDGLGSKSGGKLYGIAANKNIPSCHIRAIDVTDRINDPKENVIDQTITTGGGKQGLLMAYAQSFLREEVGKMYRGEIVLRGIPEIEPMDVLILMDAPNAIQGPVEVESVTHTYNQETGFITIIKPRCCISINESVSGGFFSTLGQVMGTAIPEVMRLTPKGQMIGLVGGLTGGAAGVGLSTFAILNTPKVLSKGISLGSKIGSRVGGWFSGGADAAAADVPAQMSFDFAAADAAAAETGAATVAVGAEGATAAVAAGEVATGAFLVSNPVGWCIIGVCVVAAVVGLLAFYDHSTGLAPLYISPCTKYGRPWMGGLEGWAINDLIGVVNNDIYQFMDEEIFPLLQLWMMRNNYTAPVVSQEDISNNHWIPQIPT